MCIPYIKLVDDPSPSHKRSQPDHPKVPMSSESAHPNPIIVELSPRLVYAPSSSRSNPRRDTDRPHRQPSAPYPSPATPQAEFIGGFEAGYQLSQEEREQQQRKLAAEGKKVEEGRAGPSGPGPEPQVQQPLVTDPGQSSQPQSTPQTRPLPAQHPPPLVPPNPAVTAPQRQGSRSPYNYVRRPQPRHRSRSRSRSQSSSDSCVSRRSFEALRRRINVLTDRLARLERWKDGKEAEARSSARSAVRTWSLGPGTRRRAEGRDRDRNVDERNVDERNVDERRDVRRDVGTNGREAWGRWDWEGGGLGRR